MDTTKENALLQNAITEIQILRKQNYEQTLRLKMFDDVMKVFNVRPPEQGSSCSPDIVYELQKQISLNNSPPASNQKENKN